MRPPGTDDYLLRFGLTFADPGTTTLDFRPGKLNFTTNRATSWSNWKGVRVVTFGSDAVSSTSARTAIGSTATSGASGAVRALPDTVTSAVVYYWPYQAVEWTPGAPVAITAGATASNTITVNQAAARPGYAYDFTAQRTDSGSHLALTVSYQVCTLKASATTIARGSPIRLSGVVSTQGHWGAAKGLPKVVTIYKRTTNPTIGQPTVWDATREGWQLADTSLANAYRNYTSAVLRPPRTTYYIVRYPDDAWYWKAFTSVIHVNVR